MKTTLISFAPRIAVASIACTAFHALLVVLLLKKLHFEVALYTASFTTFTFGAILWAQLTTAAERRGDANNKPEPIILNDKPSYWD